MTTQIGPLSEDTKEEIIATQPNGIWLVLAEENPHDGPTAEDLLSADGPNSPPPFGGQHYRPHLARCLSFRQPTGSIING